MSVIAESAARMTYTRARSGRSSRYVRLMSISIGASSGEGSSHGEPRARSG